MDKALRPDRFDVDWPNLSAEKQWKHWFYKFNNYLISRNAEDAEKLQLLADHIGSDVFEFITDCVTYDEAIELVISFYVKPKNTIHVRHLLCTCKQESGQSLEQFADEKLQL